MDFTNPFKEIEPEAVCPPNLKGEIISEIDLIRNSLLVVTLYVGELFGVALSLVNPPVSDSIDPDS